MNRREFLTGAVAVGAAAVIAPKVPRLDSMAPNEVWEPIQAVDGEGKPTAQNLHLADLQRGATYGSFQDRPVMILWDREALFSDATWRIPHPTEREVLVGYSARCTHLGCRVDYVPEGSELPLVREGAICPCHQSIFNLYQAGRVRESSPAKYDLPMLALDIRSGRVGVLSTSSTLDLRSEPAT